MSPAVASELLRAAAAMLDAFGGNYPDWLRAEAVDLAQAHAAAAAQIGADETPTAIAHHVAALECMRIARNHTAKAGDARTVRKVDEALRAVARTVGRTPADYETELVRAEQRGAEWPDNVGGRG